MFIGVVPIAKYYLFKANETMEFVRGVCSIAFIADFELVLPDWDVLVQKYA